MSILVVGISHRSAPVDLLEQVAVGVHDTARVVEQLRERGRITERARLAAGRADFSQAIRQGVPGW